MFGLRALVGRPSWGFRGRIDDVVDRTTTTTNTAMNTYYFLPELIATQNSECPLAFEFFILPVITWGWKVGDDHNF